MLPQKAVEFVLRFVCLADGLSCGYQAIEHIFHLPIFARVSCLGIQKVLRISIGGNMEQGAYITYRGDLREVQALLNEVAKRFSGIAEELEISPDEGKRYA